MRVDLIAEQRRVLALTFADLVLKTMKIREDSYDHVAADATRKKDEARQRREWKKDPKAITYSLVDYSKFYKLDMLQAAEQAAGKELGYFIYLLCTSNWNDAEMHAEALLNVSSTKTTS